MFNKRLKNLTSPRDEVQLMMNSVKKRNNYITLLKEN